MDRERRGFQTELRAHEDGDKKAISGLAAVYNSITDLGWFTEEIAPDAFRNVIDGAVRALFNHDPDHSGMFRPR